MSGYIRHVLFWILRYHDLVRDGEVNRSADVRASRATSSSPNIYIHQMFARYQIEQFRHDGIQACKAAGRLRWVLCLYPYQSHASILVVYSNFLARALLTSIYAKEGVVVDLRKTLPYKVLRILRLPNDELLNAVELVPDQFMPAGTPNLL